MGLRVTLALVGALAAGPLTSPAAAQQILHGGGALGGAGGAKRLAAPAPAEPGAADDTAEDEAGLMAAVGKRMRDLFEGGPDDVATGALADPDATLAERARAAGALRTQAMGTATSLGAALGAIEAGEAREARARRLAEEAARAARGPSAFDRLYEEFGRVPGPVTPREASRAALGPRAAGRPAPVPDVAKVVAESAQATGAADGVRAAARALFEAERARLAAPQD